MSDLTYFCLYASVFIVGLCVFAIFYLSESAHASGCRLFSHQAAQVIQPRFSSRRYILLFFLYACAGATLAVLTALKFDYTAAAAVNFLFLAFLAAVSLSDIHTMEIPDEYAIGIALCGVLAVFTNPSVLWWERLIGAVAVSVPLLLIACAVHGGFGGGDIKLMAAAGLVLGWKMILLSAFIGILLGGLYGVFLLLTRLRGRRDHFAFGPFLATGMAVCLFFGPQLLALFLKLFDFSRFF